MSDRERLLARVRQLRRAGADSPAPSGASDDRADFARVEVLEARVAHLERMLEGFQDSVHRETERQGKQIAELHEQLQPAAITAALNRDARERGL